jgi:hypothetical protein
MIQASTSNTRDRAALSTRPSTSNTRDRAALSTRPKTCPPPASSHALPRPLSVARGAPGIHENGLHRVAGKELCQENKKKAEYLQEAEEELSVSCSCSLMFSLPQHLTSSPPVIGRCCQRRNFAGRLEVLRLLYLSTLTSMIIVEVVEF